MLMVSKFYPIKDSGAVKLSLHGNGGFFYSFACIVEKLNLSLISVVSKLLLWIVVGFRRKLL